MGNGPVGAFEKPARSMQARLASPASSTGLTAQKKLCSIAGGGDTVASAYPCRTGAWLHLPCPNRRRRIPRMAGRQNPAGRGGALACQTNRRQSQSAWLAHRASSSPIRWSRLPARWKLASRTAYPPHPAERARCHPLCRQPVCAAYVQGSAAMRARCSGALRSRLRRMRGPRRWAALQIGHSAGLFWLVSAGVIVSKARRYRAGSWAPKSPHRPL